MMSGNYTTIDNQNVAGSVPAVADPSPHVAVKFADSSLQTFPPSGAQGKISGARQPPRDADDSFGKPASGSDDSQPSGSFSEKTANNPDLYWPFWICTTLIFVAASIGTFVTYIAHKVHKKDWEYDVNVITWSAGLFYGYVSVVPLALYLILKYFSVQSGFAHLLCLYGYSLFIFIPAMCLSVIPDEIVGWVVAGVAGFMSATFVALNLRNHIKSAGESWFVIVAGIFLLQLALALVLKIYLFTVSV